MPSPVRYLPLAMAALAATLVVMPFEWTTPLGRAQSLHFDVEIRTSNGPIAGSDLQVRFFGDNALLINGQAAVDHASGYGIWPADFGDLPGGPHSTDDPGFQAFAGTLLAGERIFYRPLGTALHWNPASRLWQAAPAGTSIRIEGTVPSEIAIAALVFNDPAALVQYEYYSTPTSITGQGIVGPLTKMVDEAASNGAFHTHLNWFIEGDRPAGAYLAQMQLFDPSGKYGDSTPFFVLFNHGLNRSDYESAFLSRVQAPAAQSRLVSVLRAVQASHPTFLSSIAAQGPLAPVPEPGPLWLIIAALPLIMMRRLRLRRDSAA
jgi:hypothetical protein